MEKSKEDLHRKPRRSGAVWAALALSAGLATAPVAALAEESSGTTSGTGSATGATTQKSGAQTQPQASDDDARGTVGQGATAQTGSQDTGSAEGAGTQVSAQAPVASSDKGTYEKAGLHAVTVTYVDQGGRQIAASHKEALADGESYSVKSPTIGGYEPVDASQATVSGTVAKGGGDVSIKVVYKSTMVTYKVVHERQVGPKSSEYRVSETETLRAPAGSRVTVTPKSYDNYTCATKDLTLDVTADGNATLVVKYDVIVPTYGVYFQTSGSYVAPRTGQVGDAITAPADPTRAGYSFAGWDTDGDGKADALPATIQDKDVTATAIWKPETATYLVKYWGEDQNSNGSYHLLKTETLTGTTEATTPTAAKLDTSKGGAYQWYTYLKEDPVKSAGDGTSVLNVYYDLRTVEVHIGVGVSVPREYRIMHNGRYRYNFYYTHIFREWDCQRLKMFDTVHLPSGEGLRDFYEDQFAKVKADSKYYTRHGKKVGPRKESGKPRWFTIANPSSEADDLQIFLDSSNGYQLDQNNIGWDGESLVATFRADFSAKYNSYLAEEFQDADGEGYAEPSFESTTTGTSRWRTLTSYLRRGFRCTGWRLSTNVWDGKDANAIEWGDWHVVTAKDADENGQVETEYDLLMSNVVEFRFDRIPYDVTYYSDGQVVGTTKDRLYGSEVDVSTPAGLTAPEGMVFGGWYATPDFSGDPVTSLTMPEGGVHLYALWKRPDVHVTFDPAGGSSVAAETVRWGGKATRPADPTREGYTFGGWYYQAPGSSTPAPFPFDLGLEGDVSLVAAWKSSETPTTYTVVHKTRDGKVLATWTGEGTVGQTLTVAALGAHDARRAGHDYVSASGITLDLSADASKNVYEFVYDDEPSFTYVVHLYDEATGLPVAADVTFDSERALLDYLAPKVKGYHVLFGGQGYLSIREGGQELTFWYERNPEQPKAGNGSSGQLRPATPRTATASATKTAPKHMAKVPAKPEVPRTGDATNDALALGIGALGAGIALLGSKFHRREDGE